MGVPVKPINVALGKASRKCFPTHKPNDGELIDCQKFVVFGMGKIFYFVFGDACHCLNCDLFDFGITLIFLLEFFVG